jgi:hypothetical protein
MISPKYDFDEFVDAVKGLDLHSVVIKAQDEAYEVRRRIRDVGAAEYESLLGELIFLLCEGRKPTSVQQWDLLRMRPIIEALVKRKQLKPEALSAFDHEAGLPGT